MKRLALQLGNGNGDDDIRRQLLYGCGVNEDVDAITTKDKIATMHLLLLVIEGRTIILLLLRRLNYLIHIIDGTASAWLLMLILLRTQTKRRDGRNQRSSSLPSVF
jgi:hypothetical protein